MSKGTEIKDRCSYPANTIFSIGIPAGRKTGDRFSIQISSQGQKQSILQNNPTIQYPPRKQNMKAQRLYIYKKNNNYQKNPVRK